MEILDIRTKKETPLHKIDGRVKTISIFLILFTIVAMSNLYVPAIAFLVALAILIWLGVSLRKLIYPLYIASVIFVILIFTTGKTPIFRFGLLVATKEGLRLAALVMLKVLACTSLLLILLATTYMSDIVAALAWVRIPRIVVELVVLMLRYINTITEEFRTLVFAFRSKNAFSKYISWKKRVYNFGTIAGITIIRSLDRAERVYMAMVARGYDPSKPIVKYDKLSFSGYLGISISALLCVLLIFVDKVVL